MPHVELSRWRTWLYWTRYYLGARLKLLVDSWLERSAPQQVVDGLFLVDPHGDSDSESRFATLQEALRLIEYYDPLRYRSLKRYIRRIIVDDSIPARAMYFLGTGVCVIRPDLLGSGRATIASALVHETTHARLDRLGVRQSPDRHARIESLCMSQEIDFVSHFPQTPELKQWMQNMMNHIARIERS